MRPEIRFALVVAAMVFVGGVIILFSMSGEETGDVPLENPNPPATTASNERKTPTPIPTRRSNTAASITPRESATASRTTQATTSDSRPSRTVQERDIFTPSTTNRANPSTTTTQTETRPSSTPIATRTEPATDSTTSRSTITTSPLTSNSNTSTTSRTTSSTARTTIPPRTSTRTTTPTPEADGPVIEELRPVAERPIAERRIAERTNPPRRDTNASAGSSRKHTVSNGERLWDIAAEEYGDGKYWIYIARANPDMNPDRLLVGQEISIPPRSAIGPQRGQTSSASESTTTATTRRRSTETDRPAATDRPANTARATYTVERGDSLVKIADALYGDQDRWRDIYELNRASLKNPNNIRPGMKLSLPPLPQ